MKMYACRELESHVKSHSLQRLVVYAFVIYTNCGLKSNRKLCCHAFSMFAATTYDACLSVAACRPLRKRTFMNFAERPED
jgi:hypothetical protein